jgi:hypothetical protein
MTATCTPGSACGRASLTDHYQPQVARPWRDIAEVVGRQVQAVIDTEGEFRTAGDLAAFVCR